MHRFRSPRDVWSRYGCASAGVVTASLRSEGNLFGFPPPDGAVPCPIPAAQFNPDRRLSFSGRFVPPRWEAPSRCAARETPWPLPRRYRRRPARRAVLERRLRDLVQQTCCSAGSACDRTLWRKRRQATAVAEALCVLGGALLRSLQQNLFSLRTGAFERSSRCRGPGT
jgi:hypothetical protein